MRNLLWFWLRVWRSLGSPQLLLSPLTGTGLVFLLPVKLDMQSLYETQCFCPEGHRQVLLHVILTSLKSLYYVSIWTAEQQIHCSNPREPSGKITDFSRYLFPFQTQTRTWKTKENIKISQPCCGYTLGTLIALNGMCVCAYLKPQ